MPDAGPVIAWSNATKPWSPSAPPEAGKQSTWIATSGVAGLAMTIPARVASGLIWLYQRTLSPVLVVLNPSCGCRFAPSCSHYARAALQEHGFLTGLALTFIRLAKCGPWHPGGEDPVPPRPRPACTRVYPS